jgi:quercetin dioxygenase-like cupin family protein
MRQPVTLAAALLVSSITMLSAQAAPTLQWGPAPAVFPAGAKMAVVSGDPTKTGPFVVELAFPSGYRIPPHSHPTDETIKVVKGSFRVGMGTVFDEAKTTTMRVGASGTMQAGQPHFAIAEGATIVSVSSTGPFAMTYVNPSDDPTKVMASP